MRHKYQAWTCGPWYIASSRRPTPTIGRTPYQALLRVRGPACGFPLAPHAIRAQNEPQCVRDRKKPLTANSFWGKVWRMAHRRTGKAGGQFQSGNLTTLVGSTFVQRITDTTN